MTNSGLASAITVLVCGVAACRSISRPDGAAKGQGAAKPGRPFWMHHAALTGKIDGGSLRTVDRPVLVDLLEDGRVRVASSSKDAWEGYLPSELLQTPSDKAGLALYAQRTGDVHLGSPTGLLIGRLHRGAFVGAVPTANRHYMVAMTGFRDAGGSAGKTLIGYVDADVLSSDPAPLTAPDPVGRLVTDMPPLDLWDNDKPVAVTICGSLRVLEDEQSKNISQYHAGVELIGRLDTPLVVSRGPMRCALRTVYKEGDRLSLCMGPTALDTVDVDAAPADYVRLDRPITDPLAPLIKSSGAVYWLIQTKAGPRCSEWKFKGAFERKSHGGPSREIEAELRRREWQVIDKMKTFASFGTEYGISQANAGQMVLYGPHFDSYRKGSSRPERWGYRCADVYNFVGVTDSAFRMLPIAPTDPLVAWHPDDEEHWFFERESCESAGRAASEVLARDPNATPPGGFHVDCYDELHDPDLR